MKTINRGRAIRDKGSPTHVSVCTGRHRHCSLLRCKHCERQSQRNDHHSTEFETSWSSRAETRLRRQRKINGSYLTKVTRLKVSSCVQVYKLMELTGTLFTDFSTFNDIPSSATMSLLRPDSSKKVLQTATIRLLQAEAGRIAIGLHDNAAKKHQESLST